MNVISHVEGTKAAVYVDGIAEGMTQEQVEEVVRKALDSGNSGWEVTETVSDLAVVKDYKRVQGSRPQPAAGSWISVKERLPEDCEVVLIRETCTDGSPTWDRGYIEGGVWYVTPMSLKMRLVDDTVTHWAEVRV